MEPTQTVFDSSLCQQFIVRKRRQCKFQPAPGSSYCHSHAIDLDTKIECPYEKGFYIDKSKLEKHLLNCPKVTERKKQEQSKWYQKDINVVPQLFEKELQMKFLNKDFIKKIILFFLKQFPQVNYYLESSPEEIIQNKQQYLPKYNQEAFLTNDLMQAILIVDVAQKQYLLSKNQVYIELGAGKGLLSYCFSNRIQRLFHSNGKHILLERESRRMKFDRFFNKNGFYLRYKGDVRSFDFSKFKDYLKEGYIEKMNRPLKKHEFKKNKLNEKQQIEPLKNTILYNKDQIEQKSQNEAEINVKLTEEQLQNELKQCKITAICKHMCGQALDISIAGIIKASFPACVLAPCCHHLCTLQTYLNPNYLLQIFSKEEISAFFKLSSWGTKASFLILSPNTIEKLIEKSLQQYTSEDKLIVGRMCKRIIDLGRARALNGQLKRYCSDQLTPENFIILSKGQ